MWEFVGGGVRFALVRAFGCDLGASQTRRGASGNGATVLFQRYFGLGSLVSIIVLSFWAKSEIVYVEEREEKDRLCTCYL